MNSNGLIESRILSKTDLEGLEADAKATIAKLEREIADLTAKLKDARIRLRKTQRLRLAPLEDARPTPDDIVQTLVAILEDSNAPFRLAEIQEYFREITGKDVPKATLYNHLQAGKGKLFSMHGTRGGAQWELSEDAYDTLEEMEKEKAGSDPDLQS